MNMIGVCVLVFWGVCESWWGSNSCLMCVLSCRTPHARTLSPSSCAETRQLGPPAETLVKIHDITRVTRWWPDDTQTPWGGISALLSFPIASAVWSALLIIWTPSKLTLPFGRRYCLLLLALLLILFSQRTRGDWHQLVRHHDGTSLRLFLLFPAADVYRCLRR